jgi:hypothetical protein
LCAGSFESDEKFSFKVLGSILSLLRPKQNINTSLGLMVAVPGERCLKLAALRLLRSVLSVKDELYHCHIIQNNLFEPVFETFRANPVGDNLVSSAVVEICDFILNEKINSLIEHVVKNHLNSPVGPIPRLEDVASPYVSTFTTLRKSYEAGSTVGSAVNRIQVASTPRLTLNSRKRKPPFRIKPEAEHFNNRELNDDDKLLPDCTTTTLEQPESRLLSGKALDDQRKFRELDEDESYFDSDD